MDEFRREISKDMGRERSQKADCREGRSPMCKGWTGGDSK